MTDEQTDFENATREILHIVFEQYHRLKSLGWTDPHPYTDDKYWLLIIEAASTGIHHGYCSGEESGYWIPDAGDMWPSRPLLVKRLSKIESEMSNERG